MERAADRPGDAQRETLRRLLRTNRDTRFGRSTASRTSPRPRQFRERVPVQDYETLRPYIEEQRRTGARRSRRRRRSSTRRRAAAPARRSTSPSPRRCWRHSVPSRRCFRTLQFRACPQAFAGKALGIMGAAVEGRLDSGHTVGSVSGHLYQSMPTLIRSRFVVPPEVSSIPTTI